MKFARVLSFGCLWAALMVHDHACADPRAEVRTQFARDVYHHSMADVYHEAPHPLLRAVVVLKVCLGKDGRWLAEVVRENPNQPQLTRRALSSVTKLPSPQDLRPEDMAELQIAGFTETWLFSDDGRFALRTLALAQR